MPLLFTVAAVVVALLQQQNSRTSHAMQRGLDSSPVPPAHAAAAAALPLDHRFVTHTPDLPFPMILRGAATAELLNVSFLTTAVVSAMCNMTKSSKLQLEGGVAADPEAAVASTHTVATDACFGCFSRIANAPPMPPTVLRSELESCSRMYLVEGPFKICVIIQDLVANKNSSLTGVTAAPKRATSSILRDFEECIFGQLKRELIQTCADELMASAAAAAAAETDDKVHQFLNMTSCVLAKSRCALFSGARVLPGHQQTGAAAAAAVALAVASTGDLHVLRLPDMLPAAHGLSAQRFHAADWPGTEC